MMDYSELIKALRCRDAEFGYYRKCKYYGEASDNRCVLCDSDRLAKDAAAAIEALQAENADIREELFISQRKYDEFTTIASMQNAMLAKQLPKRGEWKCSYPEIEPNPMFMYGICSICGFEQSISNKLNYCPNCGAKMEVQDGK